MPPETQTPLNKKLPQWAIYLTEFLGIVACILVATYTFIYWDSKNNKEEFIQTVVSPDPTADWKTYRNEEYGFEFKYPNLGNDTSIFDLNGDGQFLEGASPYLDPKIPSSQKAGNFYISIKKNISSKSIVDWFINDESSNHLLIKNGNYREISLPNGIKVLRLLGLPLPKEFDELGPIIGYTYFMDPSSKLVVGIFVGGQDTSLDKYGYSSKESRIKLEDQIISTFKFISTSTSAIDTSNWKTYRNEEYGFEFKYPSNFLIVNDAVKVKYSSGLSWYRVDLQDKKSTGEPWMRFELNPDGYGPIFNTKEYEVSLNNNMLRLNNVIEKEKDENNSGPGEMITTNFIENESAGLSWMFSYNSNDVDYEPIFKKILSTFKFMATSTPK